LTASIRMLNSYASKVLAVSGFVREVLLECGLDRQLVAVQHIGSSSAESIPRMPLPCLRDGKEVAFLFLGGLVPNKGAHVLVNALRQMASPPPTVIAGTGERTYEEEVRRSAPGSVQFVGRYDGPMLLDLLRRSDVLVAPTVGPDTSPQTVWESLAAGRPVLASRIGGIPDFVDHEHNGLLVLPDDASDLREGQERLRQPGLVADLAQHARLPQSVDEHLEDLESVYKSLATI
jgi:glycosyltransferase involved in cell wall biosynthesis